MIDWKDFEFKYRLEQLAYTLGEWVLGTLFTFFIIGLIIFLLGAGYCSIVFIDYTLDKTNCNLYVDNKKVYTGRTALVHIDSIGENGNTKSVNITKDKFGLFIQQKYVSNNVRLETINE